MKTDTQTEIMGMDVKKGPSPEQQAEIDRVVELFDKDWAIDVKAMEIKRKQRGFFQKLRDIFWPRRHDVFALYWWLKHEFHQKNRPNLMPFTFPVNHDNLPIPGYPMKYEIIGKWSIPKSDLKYLKKGPLARVSTNEVLVSHQIGFERFRSFIQVWWPAVVAFAIIIGLVRSLVWAFEVVFG